MQQRACRHGVGTVQARFAHGVLEAHEVHKARRLDTAAGQRQRPRSPSPNRARWHPPPSTVQRRRASLTRAVQAIPIPSVLHPPATQPPASSRVWPVRAARSPQPAACSSSAVHRSFARSRAAAAAATCCAGRLVPAGLRQLLPRPHHARAHTRPPTAAVAHAVAIPPPRRRLRPRFTRSAMLCCA